MGTQPTKQFRYLYLLLQLIEFPDSQLAKEALNIMHAMNK